MTNRHQTDGFRTRAGAMVGGYEGRSEIDGQRDLAGVRQQVRHPVPKSLPQLVPQAAAGGEAESKSGGGRGRRGEHRSAGTMATGQVGEGRELHEDLKALRLNMELFAAGLKELAEDSKRLRVALEAQRSERRSRAPRCGGIVVCGADAEGAGVRSGAAGRAPCRAACKADAAAGAGGCRCNDTRSTARK